MLPQLEPGSYYGTTRQLHELGGLSVAETTYPPGLEIPPHEHSNAFFCFVMEGSGTRSWPGRAGEERPMALTLFPGAHAHANCWHRAGGRVLHVEFARPWLERLRGRTRIFERPCDFEKGPPMWLARRIARECWEQDCVSSLAIEAFALELLAECSRSESRIGATRSPRWLESGRALLQARFADTLSLAEIAESIGVSADHLARSFRRSYGCTVGEFVRRLRVEFACRRLAETDEPLAEIAAAAGFTDQSHFTKVFRRHVGMTPAAFRTLYARRRFRTNP
jgi:AraC family transcriptional regulator